MSDGNVGALIVNVEGFSRAQMKIRQLPDKLKVREVRKILRAAAGAIRSEARKQAPKGDQIYIYPREGGTTMSTNPKRTPGTLKKSIAIFTGKSKDYVNVQVGPRGGKKTYNYDAFYGQWVQDGTVKMDANPYMSRALKNQGEKARQRAAVQVAKKIEQIANK